MKLNIPFPSVLPFIQIQPGRFFFAKKHEVPYKKILQYISEMEELLHFSEICQRKINSKQSYHALTVDLSLVMECFLFMAYLQMRLVLTPVHHVCLITVS